MNREDTLKNANTSIEIALWNKKAHTMHISFVFEFNKGISSWFISIYILNDAYFLNWAEFIKLSFKLVLSSIIVLEKSRNKNKLSYQSGDKECVMRIFRPVG